jgi:hypothetical protein
VIGAVAQALGEHVARLSPLPVPPRRSRLETLRRAHLEWCLGTVEGAEDALEAASAFAEIRRDRGQGDRP